MGSTPDVLLLDDGELDDIHQMLEDLKVPVARVRGGAIVDGTPPPRKLLVSTPRRIDAVKATLQGADNPPLRGRWKKATSSNANEPPKIV